MKACYHCGGPSAGHQTACLWCGTVFSRREVPVFVRESDSYSGTLDVSASLPGDRWKVSLSAAVTFAVSHGNTDLEHLNPLNAAEHDMPILDRARDLAAERVTAALLGMGDDAAVAGAADADSLRLLLAGRLEAALASAALTRSVNESIAMLGTSLAGPMRLIRDRLKVEETGPTRQAICPECGASATVPLAQRTLTCPRCGKALTYCRHCGRFVTSDRQERICDFCRFHL